MSHKTMKVNNNGQKQLKGKPCTHGLRGVKGEGQARSEWRGERRGENCPCRGEESSWERHGSQVNGINKEGLITMRGGRNWCQNLVGQSGGALQPLGFAVGY